MPQWNGLRSRYGTSARGQGYTVNLLNLGIPTAVIGRDFQTLGQQYGRTIEANFIDSEAAFIQSNATVVTVFAGLNEVNTITAALGGGAGGSDTNGYIDAQVRAFGSDYSTLLGIIASRAAGIQSASSSTCRTRPGCRFWPARRSRSGRRRSAPPSG